MVTETIFKLQKKYTQELMYMTWNKKFHKFKDIGPIFFWNLCFSFSLCLYKEINLEFTVLATLLYSQYENRIFKQNMKRYNIVLAMCPKTRDKNTPKLE